MLFSASYISHFFMKIAYKTVDIACISAGIYNEMGSTINYSLSDRNTKSVKQQEKFINE